MKKTANTVGLFALFYTLIFGLLYLIGEFFPSNLSLLHPEVFLSVTLIYTLLFFAIIYYQTKRPRK